MNNRIQSIEGHKTTTLVTEYDAGKRDCRTTHVREMIPFSSSTWCEELSLSNNTVINWSVIRVTASFFPCRISGRFKPISSSGASNESRADQSRMLSDVDAVFISRGWKVSYNLKLLIGACWILKPSIRVCIKELSCVINNPVWFFLLLTLEHHCCANTRLFNWLVKKTCNITLENKRIKLN